MIPKEINLWLNIFSGESTNDTRLSLISILNKGISKKIIVDAKLFQK